MAQGHISKSVVDALTPAEKEFCLWDDEVKGFGVKVTPKGAKSYIMQYRMGGAGSPTKRFLLGKVGDPNLTAHKARRLAEAARAQIREGDDPQAAKLSRRREAVDLAFDKYAQRFLDHYGPRHWSEQTLADNKRYLTAKGAPVPTVLGDKALPAIKRADIAAVFDDVPAEKPGYARNLYSCLRKLFAWAVERGDIDRSPMEGFKGPRPVPSRDRVLNDVELSLVWRGAQNLGYPFGPLYRLLVATGQRREEVASIDWRRLDRKAREWRLTAAETKNDKAHVVPLNAMAVAELDAIAGGDEWPVNGLVFTTTGKTPVGGFSKGKTRLDAEVAKLGQKQEPAIDVEAWRIHDLRRTFATGMQRLGIRFEVTEAALNHVSGSKSGVAGVYQRHDWRDEKRSALDAWSRHLEALQTGSGNNVVKFPVAQ